LKTKNGIVINLDQFKRQLAADKRRAEFDDKSIAMDPAVQRGIEIVQKMSAQDRNMMTAFFLAWLETEIAVSLGMIEDKELESTPLFDLVERLYKDATGGCYFCDKTLDPNAVGIDSKTHLCIRCRLKLANFLTMMGEDPTKYIQGIFGPRKVQKARFNKR
jgi:hypothetical protein